MKLNHHLTLATVAISGWFFYFLIGIPSHYYQDWSFSEQILLTLISLGATIPIISFITILLVAQNFLKTGLWLAFYSSIPLAAIDFLFTGVIQEKGFQIFKSHWYLTVGYFGVWIIMPLTAVTLQNLKMQILKQ